MKEWAFWASFYDTSAAAGRQPLAVPYFEQLTFRPTIDSHWPAHPSEQLATIPYAHIECGRSVRGDCALRRGTVNGGRIWSGGTTHRAVDGPGGPLIWGDCLSRDRPKAELERPVQVSRLLHFERDNRATKFLKNRFDRPRAHDKSRLLCKCKDRGVRSTESSSAHVDSSDINVV